MEVVWIIAAIKGVSTNLNRFEYRIVPVIPKYVRERTDI